MHTHITVTAPEGRKTPIAPNDGVDPSGTLLYVDPGSVCRVRYSADVRRAIGRGDLVLCDLQAKPVKELEQAACPKQLEEVIEDHYGGDKCDLKKLKEHREQLAKAKAEAEAAAKAEADATKAKADEEKKQPKTEPKSSSAPASTK